MGGEDRAMAQRSSVLPTREHALPGRAERMSVAARHYVSGAPLEGRAPGLAEALPQSSASRWSRPQLNR